MSASGSWLNALKGYARDAAGWLIVFTTELNAAMVARGLPTMWYISAATGLWDVMRGSSTTRMRRKEKAST